MDFFLQQQMPRSDASTIVGFVPLKGHYGVAHVCGDPDKRAVLDDRPNRAEPTSLPPSITVAAHNPTYARHTRAESSRHPSCDPATDVSGLRCKESTGTVLPPPRLTIAPSAGEARSSFSRVAGRSRPLQADIGSSPFATTCGPTRKDVQNMTIHHQSAPAYDIDHLDGIYQSVEALIESMDERDSDLAVALRHEDQCPHYFRQALLHVIELLPRCGTTAVAVDMAQQHHMTCLQVGLLPATAMEDLIAL